MILTCPRCATRFLVEAQEIPPDGRRVRCSECGEEWRADAHHEGPEASPPVGAEPPADPPPPLVDPPQPAFAAPQVAAPPLQEPAPAPPPAEPPLVAPIRTRRPPIERRSASPGLAILLVLGLVILLTVLAIGLRPQIEQAWPASAPIYRSLGLPADRAPPPTHAAHG